MNKKLPIFYSALLLTCVNLLLRFVSTGFQVYLSREIGASGIGLLQLVLSVGNLSMTLAMAGIRTATMYLTAEQLGKNRLENISRVLSGCIRYSLTCSISVALLIWFFAPLIAAHWLHETDTTVALRLFACFLPTNCMCGVMIGYFTAANKIGMLSAVEVGEQVCSMLLTIILLQNYAVSNTMRACCSVIAGSGFGSIITLVSLLVLRRKEKVGSISRIPVMRKLLYTAVPLALADNLKSGISTVENLMVPSRLALYTSITNPLAAFGVVCGMVFPVMMFPAAILFGLSELLIPELARCSAAGSKRRINYLAGRSLRIAMLYGCLFAGLFFIASEELCFFLYQNTEAGIYLKLFSLLVPMLYCDAITDAMIKGLGQQIASVRYNILTSCMDVMLLYVLLPRYGMYGYFVSFCVTHLINFALSLRRLFKLTGRVILPHVPVLMLGATYISALLSNSISLILCRCTSYFLILGSLLYLFRVVGKDDIGWLKTLIKSREAVRVDYAVKN